MARRPGPVRPRRKDERAYETVLRARILTPLFAALRGGLLQAVSASEAYERLRRGDRPLDDDAVAWLDISGNFASVEAYHRRRIIATFRSALGVDIRPYLLQPDVAAYLRQVVADNVALIRTIPQVAHQSLRDRLAAELAEAPFDRARLTTLLRDEYRSTGYRVRRLARDQTSKTIGRLTEIRHRQIGVRRYRWSTSLDERVRDTHRVHDGEIFAWASPPPATGHPGEDIQCRCVAIPIIEDDLRRKLAPRQRSPAR